MGLKTEDSKTKVTKPDNDTTAIIQKDSTPDSTSTETAESNETAVPPPFTAQAAVATTPNSTTSLRPLEPATQATTATISDDARRLNIDNVTLRFNTINEALGDGLMGREPLSIENDDVALVKNLTNSKAWVKRLIEAFGREYLAESEDPSKTTPKQKEWFARWQKQAHLSVVAIFEAKNPAHLEKSCWHLFDAVIKAHELGVVDAANHMTPSNLRCSERLSLIVSIIEKYALVRLDVLRPWHVDEIAANPEAFIKRKITNCWNNGHRAERLANKTADERAIGKGSGRKRKACNEEEEQAEKSDVQTPVKTKKARESGSEGDDANEDGQSHGKSSTERPRTARTLDSDDEKSSTSERPTTSKGQSDDEVKTPGVEGSDDGHEK